MRKLLYVFSILIAVQVRATPIDDLADYWGRTLVQSASKRLLDASNILADRMDKLCQKPTSDRVEVARASFTDTLTSWRDLNAIPTQLIAAGDFEGVEISIPQAEEAIRVASAASNIAGALPQPTKRGLSVLEYLLWGEDRPLAQLGRLRFKQRCGYAELVSTDLAIQAAQLNEAMGGAQPVADSASFVRSAIKMLEADIIHLRDQDIGLADGKPPQRQNQSHWRSRQTRQVSLATLQGFQTVLLGDANPLTLILSAHPELIDNLRIDIDIARSAIEHMESDGSLTIADQQTAFTALTHLSDLVHAAIPAFVFPAGTMH